MLGAEGLHIVHAEAAISSEKLRRVCNVFYSRVFAERLDQALLLCHCSLREALTRLQRRVRLGGGSLACLMPEHRQTVWCVEGIFQRPLVFAWAKALSENAHRRVELKVFAIDDSMKVALGLKGYKKNILRPSADKADVAWRPTEMISRTLVASARVRSS